MKIAQDLMNKRFGRLLVIGRTKNKTNRTLWKCQCDCGTIKYITISALLRQDGKNTQSCGCLQKERTSKANTIGYGEASFNGIYCTYKGKARRSKLEFTLTKEDFKRLTKANCYYCGVEPSQILKRGNSSSPYIYNGVDRVDNKKGYTLENSVACCGTCNKAKGILTYNEFTIWIKRIYSYTIGD